MTRTYSHIGFHLKRIRMEKQLTQSELAEGICSRSYISLLEKGQVTPSSEILAHLAERLQVDIRELTASSEAPHSYQTALLEDLVHFIEEKDWEKAQSLLQLIETKETAVVEYALFAWAKGAMAESKRAYKEAEEWYQKSLKQAKADGLLEVQIRVLDSLGALYGRDGSGGNPADSAPLFNEALQLVQQGNVNGRLKISLLFNAGNMYLRLAEYVAAAHYFTEALQLTQAYRTEYLLDYIYNSLGIFYSATKQYDTAEYYMLQAIRIYEQKRKNDPTVLNIAYTNLSIVYRMTDRDDEAINYLKKANELSRSFGYEFGFQNSLIEMAKVLRKQGKFAEALDICRNVMEIGKHDVLAEAQLVTAEILAEQGEEAKAICLLEQALDGLRKKSMNLFLPKTYQLLGKLYFKRGEFERSARMFEQCAELTLHHWQNKTSII